MYKLPNIADMNNMNDKCTYKKNFISLPIIQNSLEMSLDRKSAQDEMKHLQYKNKTLYIILSMLSNCTYLFNNIVRYTCTPTLFHFIKYNLNSGNTQMYFKCLCYIKILISNIVLQYFAKGISLL